MVQFLLMDTQYSSFDILLLPGYTSDECDLIKTRKFIETLSNVEKIECAPCKTMHLDDLIFRMKNREESLSKTLDMIESQRQTLKIQGFGKS